MSYMNQEMENSKEVVNNYVELMQKLKGDSWAIGSIQTLLWMVLDELSEEKRNYYFELIDILKNKIERGE